MTSAWTELSLATGDRLLGWLVGWPRDAAILLLGVLAGGLCLALRRWLVSPRFDRILRDDLHRLATLQAQSRAAGDAAACTRHRHVRSLVNAERARRERPLLLAPLLLLAWVSPWGDRRLLPARRQPDESFELVLEHAGAAEGELAQIVPQPGLAAPQGWIRILWSGETGPGTSWRLKLAAGETVCHLKLRLGDHTVRHQIDLSPLTVVQPTQSTVAGITTRLVLREHAPLGLLPPRLPFGIPTWSVLVSVIMAGVYWSGCRARGI